VVVSQAPADYQESVIIGSSGYDTSTYAGTTYIGGYYGGPYVGGVYYGGGYPVCGYASTVVVGRGGYGTGYAGSHCTIPGFRIGIGLPPPFFGFSGGSGGWHGSVSFRNASHH
jgi:hypothetical protein